MPRYVLYATVMLAVAACSTGSPAAIGGQGAGSPQAAGPGSPPHSAALRSGVETQYVDDAVRAQDDLYRHLNGRWLDTFEIPADKGSYGAFAYIDDTTQEQLRSIVESLAASGGAGAAARGSDAPGGDAPGAAAPGGDAQKIADFYASFMDEERLEA